MADTCCLWHSGGLDFSFYYCFPKTNILYGGNDVRHGVGHDDRPWRWNFARTLISKSALSIYDIRNDDWRRCRCPSRITNKHHGRLRRVAVWRHGRHDGYNAYVDASPSLRIRDVKDYHCSLQRHTLHPVSYAARRGQARTSPTEIHSFVQTPASIYFHCSLFPFGSTIYPASRTITVFRTCPNHVEDEYAHAYAHGNQNCKKTRFNQFRLTLNE